MSKRLFSMLEQAVEPVREAKKIVLSYLQAWKGVEVSAEETHHGQDALLSEQQDTTQPAEVHNSEMNEHTKPAIASTPPNGQPGTISGQQSSGSVTPEEVLNWLIERLDLLGAIGLPTSWDPEQFSTIFSVSADPPPTTEDIVEDNDLTAAAGRLIRASARDEWLKKAMFQHQALFPQVHELVASKLLAYGVPESRLQSMAPGQKLQWLTLAMNNQLPPGATSATGVSSPEPVSSTTVDVVPKFTVYLVLPQDPEGERKETIKLYFTRDTTFVRFLGELRDTSSYAARRTGKNGGYTLADGAWYYQLVGPDKSIVPGSQKIPVVDEKGFAGMVKQTENLNSPSVFVIHNLTQRLFEKFSAAQTQARTHDLAASKTEDVELDEDGNEYFEDVDWELLERTLREGELGTIIGGRRMFE